MALFGGGNVDHSAQLDRIEKKLDKLLSGVGIGAGSPAASEPSGMDQVRALAAGGRKIEAIKMYREMTGLGLKEAKDAVDLM